MSCSVLTGTMDEALASLYRGGRKLGGVKQRLNSQVTEWECQTRLTVSRTHRPSESAALGDGTCISVRSLWISLAGI